MYPTDWIRLFILAGLIFYAMVVSGFYGEYKQLCAAHGRTASITPSLEGYCEKPLADGSIESIPVERFIHPHKYGFQPR